MRTVKTYKLRKLTSLTTFITINGKTRDINFKGLHPYKGLFVTDDDEVQKQLEASNEFGKLYKLESTIYEKTPAELREEAKVNDKENEENTSSTEAVTETEEVQDKEIKVKNIQEANAQAKKLFGKDAPTFRSSEKAVEYFKSNGYKLEFDK